MRRIFEAYEKLIENILIYMYVILIYLILAKQWITLILFGFVIISITVGTKKETKKIKEMIEEYYEESKEEV